ncbi:MAG TPA: ankyrin repeat domain-containing protein [Candidatus Cryosericum sp.]|nr:ankyrin repeat domain-containing protein [Candidatus Cryosericum sp.]
MDRTEEVFAAVAKGDGPRLEAILDQDPAAVNARNERGDSLLLAAAYAERREIFEILLRRGAGVNLFEAAALGLGERAQELLGRDPHLVNAHSHDGWTALHLASFFGHRDLAALLLDQGADVNARSRSERFARDNTPLHAAAANRHVEVAGLLLERGAEINAKDGSGFTPLALAANSRSDLLMLLLLEKGARAD